MANVSSSAFLTRHLKFEILVFMEEVFIRVYMNLNLRRKEFEKAFQVALPEKKAMGAFANKSQQWQRYIAYQKGFEGSDMELAEALWTYLAPSEDFEIEGLQNF